MFFGCFSINNRLNKNSSLKLEMEEIFKGHNGQDLSVVDKSNAYILYSDIGVKGASPGSFESNHEKQFLLISGEPFFENCPAEDEVGFLAQSISNKNYQILKSSRGVFCGAAYSEVGKPDLHLYVDKLAIRPLYYWTDGNYVVFSTLLKFLEKFSFVPKKADEISLSEIIGFGYPLGNRTQYLDIKLLREAEVLRFSEKGLESYSYWRWDKIQQIDITPEESTAEAYRVFKESIQIRLHGDTNALAFLSGGMDSRAIVGALADLGVEVEAFNFSPTGSQDQIFAARFAEQVGCRLNLTPRDEKFALGFRCQLARLVKDLVDKQKMTASRPRAIWSGDGGSVCVGCVYLNKQIVEMMRAGNKLEAAQHFMKIKKINLPLKIMKNHKAKQFDGLLLSGIMSELNRLECADPAKEFFFFLVLNDQRRHLYDVYEDIDSHCLEYQLPFFDSQFLEFIFSLPLDYLLNHQFYTDWFYVFPSAVTDIPWQTYPGHVPCPLPFDENLGYQWEKESLSFSEKIKKSISIGFKGFKITFLSPNVGPVSRLKFFLASVMHFFGIRDYEYLVKAGNIYSKYNELERK